MKDGSYGEGCSKEAKTLSKALIEISEPQKSLNLFESLWFGPFGDSRNLLIPARDKDGLIYPCASAVPLHGLLFSERRGKNTILVWSGSW